MNERILLAVIIAGIGLGIVGLPNVFAQVEIDHSNDWITLPNGTLVPYVINQTSDTITLQSKQGSYIFNNSTCSFSFYNGSSTSDSSLIPFDNYKVLAELNGTTSWNQVSTINNAEIGRASCRERV